MTQVTLNSSGSVQNTFKCRAVRTNWCLIVRPRLSYNPTHISLLMLPLSFFFFFFHQSRLTVKSADTHTHPYTPTSYQPTLTCSVIPRPVLTFQCSFLLKALIFKLIKFVLEFKFSVRLLRKLCVFLSLCRC